ncbi:uncharacterized protein DNG_02891 [Cephalotrichum gorgonifer]|uniref:Uncharacterized protein n=1 Tax=Cephalotrichum gorgonifer TaxID=2041049 RepID=A0AAE8MT77_9PEZI|nr:uncharacterized protein DNG_02891 [Cephalotrichum gorgonifer]
MNCCGMRPAKEIVEPRIEDVVKYGNQNEEWWKERPGLLEE